MGRMTRQKLAILLAINVIATCTLTTAAFAVPAGSRTTAPPAVSTAASPASTPITPVSGLDQQWTSSWEIGSAPNPAAYPGVATSSPAVGDVTGDGIADVVVGGIDSNLRIYNASTGVLEMAYPLEGPIQSSPVLVDLFHTGTLQVLVSSASSSAPPNPSAVDVLSFNSGTPQLLFHQTTNQPTRPDASPEPFLATPAYGDIDGDGQPEIVAVNLTQYLYAWKLSGAPVFAPKFLYDTLYSSPTLVDWNHDGRDEIVFGGDMSNYPGSPFPNAKGLIWSIQGNGAISPGYPIQIPDQTIWSPITVTDLDNNGRWAAVVDTGMNYTGGGNEVYAYDLATKLPIGGFPVPVAGRTYSDPAVVTLPGQTTKTIFTGTGRGWLYAISASGQVLWLRCTTRFTPCTENGNPGGADFLQVMPTVADIDSDGRLEVVVSTEQDLKIYDAATGAPRNFTDTPTERDGSVTVAGSMPNVASPSIAQVNGRTMIFLHGVKVNGTPPHPRAGDTGFLQAWSLPDALGAAPWSTFKGSFARTGVAGTLTDVLPAARSFVRASFQDFLQRPPTAAELTSYSQSVGYGQLSKAAYLAQLSTSDAWLSAIVTNLYETTLGRGPDAGGLAYWTGLLRNSTLTVAAVAASFYSSEEYFTNIGGGTVTSWLTNLYSTVLHRLPDSGGLGYWASIVTSQGRSAVTYAFYQSSESARTRVIGLYQSLLGRGPDPTGLSYWAGAVPMIGDLKLAVLLASSPEYQSRAIVRFAGMS